MGLLQDIQVSLLDEKAKIAPILFKLRFLAHRLESDVLEDWVRFELEGYPKNSLVPEYRMAVLTYTGTLTDGLRTISNNGIPNHVIKTHCGEQWVKYSITESLPAIERMIFQSENGKGEFGIDVSNLKLLLDGKIYQGFNVIELQARISSGTFFGIVNTVRSRLLNFVLELEQKVPVSADIVVGGSAEVTSLDTDKVAYLTQNIFNAPVQNITTSGTASTINANVIRGDVESLKKALEALGLAPTEAHSLANIASGEKPGATQRIGERASEWIKSRVSRGADGILKIGGKIMEDDITNLLREFYDNLT